MKKTRHYAPKTLENSNTRTDFNSKAVAFKQVNSILAAQNTLDVKLSVKAMSGVQDNEDSDGRKRTLKDKKKSPYVNIGGIVFDPKATKKPGQYFKPYVKIQERLAALDPEYQEEPNYGWVDRPNFGSGNLTEDFRKGIEALANKPKVIVNIQKVNPKTGKPVQSESIQVKKLGPTLAESNPGGKLIHAAARAAGLVIDELGKFRCPPGTPAANQFTDRFGTNCFDLSPKELYDLVENLARQISQGIDIGSPTGMRSIFGRRRAERAARQAANNTEAQRIGEVMKAFDNAQARIATASAARDGNLKNLMNEFGITESGDDLQDSIAVFNEINQRLGNGEIDYKTILLGQENLEKILGSSVELEERLLAHREELKSLLSEYLGKNAASGTADKMVEAHGQYMYGIFASFAEFAVEDPEGAKIRNIIFKPVFDSDGKPFLDENAVTMPSEKEKGHYDIYFNYFNVLSTEYAFIDIPSGSVAVFSLDGRGNRAAEIAALKDGLTEFEYWQTYSRTYGFELTGKLGEGWRTVGSQVFWHEDTHVLHYQLGEQRLRKEIEKYGFVDIPTRLKNKEIKIIRYEGDPDTWDNSKLSSAIGHLTENAADEDALFGMSLEQMIESRIDLLAGEYGVSKQQKLIEAYDAMIAGITGADLEFEVARNSALFETQAEMRAGRRVGLLASPEIDKVLEPLDRMSLNPKIATGEIRDIETILPDFPKSFSDEDRKIKTTKIPDIDETTGLPIDELPKISAGVADARQSPTRTTPLQSPAIQVAQQERFLDKTEIDEVSKAIESSFPINSTMLPSGDGEGELFDSAIRREVLEEFGLTSSHDANTSLDSKMNSELIEGHLEPVLSALDKIAVEGDFVIDVPLGDLLPEGSLLPGESKEIDVPNFITGKIAPVEKVETPQERFARLNAEAGNSLSRSDVRDSGKKTYNGETIYEADNLDAALALFMDGHHVDLGEYKEISALISDLSNFAKWAKGEKIKEPTFNLCKIYKQGTNVFCAKHHGIARLEMPQIAGRVTSADSPVIRAWKSGLIKGGARDAFNANLPNPTLTKDEYIALGNRFYPGNVTDPLSEAEKAEFFRHTDITQVEPDATEEFVSFLGTIGVNVADTKDVDPRTLKATQQELQGSKVANLSKAIGGYADDLDSGKISQEEFDRIALNGAILISRDGYILDGHHRVFGKISLNLDRDENKQLQQRVRVVDMSITELLEVSRAFQDHIGIAAASADPNAPGALKDPDINNVPDITPEDFASVLTNFENTHPDLIEKLDRETFFKVDSPGLQDVENAQEIDIRARWEKIREEREMYDGDTEPPSPYDLLVGTGALASTLYEPSGGMRSQRSRPDGMRSYRRVMARKDRERSKPDWKLEDDDDILYDMGRDMPIGNIGEYNSTPNRKISGGEVYRAYSELIAGADNWRTDEKFQDLVYFASEGKTVDEVIERFKRSTIAGKISSNEWRMPIELDKNQIREMVIMAHERRKGKKGAKRLKTGSLELVMQDADTDSLVSRRLGSGDKKVAKIKIPAGSRGIVSAKTNEGGDTEYSMLIPPGRLKLTNDGISLSAEVIKQSSSDEILNSTESRLRKVIDRTTKSNVSSEGLRSLRAVQAVQKRRSEAGFSGGTKPNKPELINTANKNSKIRESFSKENTELFKPSSSFITKNKTKIDAIDKNNGTSFANEPEQRFNNYRERLSKTIDLLRNSDSMLTDEKIEISDNVKKLLETATNEQIQEVVSEFARRFHSTIDKKSRIKMSKADVEKLLVDGKFERTKDNSSVGMLLDEIDMSFGFPENIDTSTKPIIAEIRHSANDQSFRRKNIGKSNANSKFFGDDSEIRVVLNKNVSGRTAYGYKDFKERDSFITNMNEPNSRDIELAITDISKDSDSNVKKMNDLAAILDSAIDTRYERQAGTITNSNLRGYVAGGFSSAEVDSIEYPLSLLGQSIDDGDPIIGKQTITEKLKNLGLTDIEIQEFFAAGGAIGGGLNASFSQRLMQFREASRVKQGFSRFGLNNIVFTNPEGIDIFDPNSYVKGFTNSAVSAEKILINESLQEVNKLLPEYAEKIKKKRMRTAS